jgi:DNA helicase-2/ATP-dependent DNA helicase PcrA
MTLTLERLVEVLGMPVSDEQAAVVTAPLEGGVVVAGAGSGKTATMVARVVWLVGTGQVEPDQVLGLTFTTKAADELATRVRLGLRRLRAAGLLPAGASSDDPDLEPTVSTYHAYAGRLVRDHALRLGREPGARLVTPATSWQLAARAVSSYDGPMDAVPWAESTVVQAVLALAGDLAEHLVDAEPCARSACGCGRPPTRRRSCSRRRRRSWAATACASSCSRSSTATPRSSASASCSTSATSSRWPPSSPETAPSARGRAGGEPGGAARRVPGHGRRARGAAVGLFGAGHPSPRSATPARASTAGAGRAPARCGASLQPSAHPPGHRARSAPPTAAADGSCSWPTPCPTSCGPRACRCPACGRRPTRAGPGRCAARCSRTLTPRRPGRDEVVAGRPPCPRPAARTGRRAEVLWPQAVHVLRCGPPCTARCAGQVVGLGGLLAVPEVPTCGPTLTVLDDPAADAACCGCSPAPWRIGPRDLAALGRRAGSSARGRAAARRPGRGRRPRRGRVAGRLAGRRARRAAPRRSPRPAVVEGRLRLEALRDELRALRRASTSRCPSSSPTSERTLGLDVEVSARPAAADPAAARADLDAFADAACAVRRRHRAWTAPARRC